MNTSNAAGESAPAGLYDPANDHDSCGIGLIVKIDGRPLHSIVENGLKILINLEHRGATGGDKSTGDGAGMLLQLPDAFFRRIMNTGLITLPSQNDYATAMVFMPANKDCARLCKNAFETAVNNGGMSIISWREVPVNDTCLGNLAKSTMPSIKQCFIKRGAADPDRFEQKLYGIRRNIEKTVTTITQYDTSQFYIASMSAKTIIYKGLFTGTQLSSFYSDLSDPDFASSFALVHQRYSTNTLPTWNLAQPFRFVAHNGEINTLRGNINRMKAREATLKSDVIGPELTEILPVIDERGSDSAIFDNVLELLITAGRSIPHAMMMMIPEPWGTKFHISQDKRAFYEYHSTIMEPWDGPAAMVFADGRYVGAMLDRNGLRPARWTSTREGVVVMASETGVLDFPGDKILSRGKLQPGRMFLIDLAQKRIISDNEIKAKICRQSPYRHWVKDNWIDLRGLFAPSEIPPENPEMLIRKQVAFGYTEDELKAVVGPMATYGQEPVGSMGDDAALAVLSNRPQLLFSYFKQLFAQVTNPPIDPLREELVMSLMSYVGRERNLLEETPEHCRRLKLHHPILTPEDMARLRTANHPEIVCRNLDALFPAKGGGAELETALHAMFAQAEKYIAEGATLLVITDARMDQSSAAIPVLLATSGLHHHLIRKGLRPAVGLIVETGEAREVMHFALLTGYGANAICPHVAFSTIRALAETKALEKELSPNDANDLYISAIKKGLLKTFSRMGISTLRSYFGAQIFEIVGISTAVVNEYFCNTASRVEGISLHEIAMEVCARHARAFPETRLTPKNLGISGTYALRKEGEKHLWTPETIYLLQHATRANDYAVFKQYSQRINDQSGAHVTLRSLFTFKPTAPVPIDQVEPVESLIKRFVASAMSLGSLSKEAHETIAIALNRAGGRSNSGEGGEAPERYATLPNGDSMRSRVKQVASARFGVTTDYLIHADELQIKIAQGAKPGEGGQLPGHKVSAEIARVRHTTPGVTLISPPPHHDIYSIEDLAQLIYDLKCVNPKAMVSVKLVSEVGVGTIAAGVAKAKADIVLISGHDGGTGASPLTSIKYAGLPWELGLAETQHALIANQLRDKIRVQTDGQLKTGRDLAVAALLGAEEFGFGTTLLVTLGCVMLRKCHLNTCVMGVATQDPALRARFKGKPEYVERFLIFMASELREYMARLGFTRLEDMIGRADLLTMEKDIPHLKARTLNFDKLLHLANQGPRTCTVGREAGLESALDNTIIRLSQSALEKKEQVNIALPVRNIHRSVGAMLSGDIVRTYGPAGLPPDTIRLFLKGSAGQSLGAFLAPGVTIHVEGDANDYLGKSMSGGLIIIDTPKDASFLPHENVILGNTALYGATGGEVFIHGIAGERFAVRNSGAQAVLEGLGDHGCEYMTGGTVVVLGQTGNNFAAGMSGGVAYVYDESQLFDTRCNLDMVDIESVWLDEDKKFLRVRIETYFKHTGSLRAKMILENWETHIPLFVKVIPIEYRASLARMKLAEHKDDETVSATEEVFHG